jgi:predicted Ser/Thr protein kinase
MDGKASSDEFILQTSSELPNSTANSETPVIVSAGLRSCFAYRNGSNSVVFGGIESDRQITIFAAVNISTTDRFTVGSLASECYFFYVRQKNIVAGIPPKIGGLKEDQNIPEIAFGTTTDGGLFSINALVLPGAPFPTFYIGISYSTGGPNGVRFGIAKYTQATISEVDFATSFPGIETITGVSSLSFQQFGQQTNLSVVLLSNTSIVWMGTLISGTSSYFVTHDTLGTISGAYSLSSQVLSADSGIICYCLSASCECQYFIPSTSARNTTGAFSLPATTGSTSFLSILNNDNGAVAFFVHNGTAMPVIQLQRGIQVSESTFGIAVPSTLTFSVTNANNNNTMHLLARTESNGAMQLMTIQYSFCGDNFTNPNKEECDGTPGCNSNCTLDLTAPFVVANPNAQPSASTAPSFNPPTGSGSPMDGTIITPTDGQGAQQVDSNIIVPAVVVPVAVLAVGLIILLVLLRRRKQRKGSLLHGKSSVEIAMESIDDRLKIPYKSLVFKKEIGAGSYGKVYVGEWKGTPVAIKVSSSVSDMDGFFDEARITVGLQQHPNVVQTFGVSLDGQLPCIVLELCEGGSLDNRLFDSDVTMTQQQKIALIKGIARGLYHLHTNNIVHRDLAARNVLLNKSGTPKISDFGMSRVLKSEAEKGKTKTNYGPIRWMAPESLRDLQYSTKSDVWSFGIVVYEIISRNEPHIDVDPLEVAVKIKNEAYHPSLPSNVPEVLRELMLSCWQPDPDNRPSMEQLCNRLNSSFPDE